MTVLSGAVGLRPIHCRISLPQHRVCTVTILWKQADADARGNLKFTTVNEKRSFEAGADFPGNLIDIPGTFELAEQYHELIAALAALVALVPMPRAHLTRYHGVFAPASPDRARVVPKTRVVAAGKTVESGEPSVVDRQWSLTWAQRLKRVFAIDIEVCRRCGGKLRVIANIEDPPVIERILEHLGGASESANPAHPRQAKRRRRQSRAPPQGDLLI